MTKLTYQETCLADSIETGVCETEEGAVIALTMYDEEGSVIAHCHMSVEMAQEVIDGLLQGSQAVTHSVQ